MTQTIAKMTVGVTEKKGKKADDVHFLNKVDCDGLISADGRLSSSRSLAKTLIN